MDLKQLRYFVSTVESGSISRAAARLNVAQPSLSQRIGELEGELGARLLHRSTSGVRPTEIGLLVAERARAILRGADNLITAARSTGAAPRGDVMVGLPTSMAIHLTVPLALQVRQNYPGINLRISEGMSGHILEWVLNGRLDLAVLYTAENLPQLDMGEVIYEELSLISRAEPGPCASSVPMHELHRYDLVLPAPDHGLRRTIARGTKAAGAALHVAVEVDSLINLKRLAMQGSLHTILPRAACLDEIRTGQLMSRRITAPPLRRPIVVVSPRERPLTLGGELIRELLCQLIAAAMREAEQEQNAAAAR